MTEAFINDNHNPKGEWKKSESKQPVIPLEAKTLPAIKYVNITDHGK